VERHGRLGIFEGPRRLIAGDGIDVRDDAAAPVLQAA